MSNAFLQQAIRMAVENVHRGGGPFAALVVKGGMVIASGCNEVTRRNDPTAHAEIMAIREACRTLGSFQLTGCDVYSSCEPCPMCLGAIFWARPERVFFAATRDDAAAAGFDDTLIYQQVSLPQAERAVPMIHLIDPQSARPFQEWANLPQKEEY